jgi:hypothetical protein
MTARLTPPLGEAIERARLVSRIRDLTGLVKTRQFKGEPRRAALARTLADLAERTSVDSPHRPRLLTALRLAAVGSKGWSAPKVRGRDVQAGPTGPFPGYVTSSHGEETVVRLALLLRLMKRERDAIDLLVRRLESGLPDAESRWWLSHLLEQMGEKKARALTGASAPSPLPPSPPAPASSCRYGIVMLAMFDSPVFRSSLSSLVASDYAGRIIVVEDGYEPEQLCRGFCESLGVTYLKRATWTGSAAAMNEGIEALASHVDVVAFVHSDILWPRTWFGAFDRAWSAVYASGKVGLINLGYLQFRHKLDTALTELFLGGQYEHLRWVLTAARDVSAIKDDRIQDSQVKGGEGMFGLSRDPWNDWVPDARFMTGRFSVAASFPVRLWRDMGGFDPKILYGFDLELQHHCLTRRQWMLFLNNAPLIHLASSDTRAVDPGRRAAAEVHQTLPAFEAKYGWQVEHFLNIYFSESAFIYQDEIVRAANALRFEDIDFVFDDFTRRINQRTLENCELTWCRSRQACPYSASGAPAASPSLTLQRG